MGLYAYIDDYDRINMRVVSDKEIQELFSEAIQLDETLMIDTTYYNESNGLFRKPNTKAYYTVYHECFMNGKPMYQARQQMSASGSKQLVMAYLYGIINGSHAYLSQRLNQQNDKN